MKQSRVVVSIIIVVAFLAFNVSCHRAGGKLNIVETLEAEGHFKALLEDISTTGLSDKLTGKGSFTVFAPNDHAYATAREGYHMAVKGLHLVEPLPVETNALLQVLLHHVLPRKIMGSEMKKRLEDKTLGNMVVSYDIEGDVAVLSSRPANAVRRLNDMFMINLGPFHTPEGEKAFGQREYTANIISTDIEASNGVIHVIDAVLLHPIDNEGEFKK